MTILLAILVVLLLLMLVWWMLRRPTPRAGGSRSADNLDTLASWPPQATRVLTSAERQAYDLLRSAFPAHMILAQVPLQRFIKVPTRNSYAEWLRRVGQINADLVVCDRHSQVIAVVEIESEDDPTGRRAQRRRKRMLRVLKSAQIPVHLWRAGTLPTAEAARHAILPLPPAEEAAVAVDRRAAPDRVAPMAMQEEARLASADEAVEMREPPPSTWFDDLDTAPAPLAGEAAKDGNPAKRPGH